MANATTLRRATLDEHSRFSIESHARRYSEQGYPLTLAAIREAKEGKVTGCVDTTSIESFIKTCSE